ncbi:MAG: beta galactosidase jelly roll domain-containing protein, partial [Ignavibacteriaceae bacterium]
MLFYFFITALIGCSPNNSQVRITENFCDNWKFHLGNVEKGQEIELNDSSWRTLNLPHDWSIEGEFSKDNPAGVGGGALPGGIGWYRKTFTLSEADSSKLIFIDFDGVYRNSEVWINGHYLGMRPYGYSSFRYELTSYLNFGNKENVLAVKVDNSKQPNSRWYSGSGIYRNVWLVTTNKVYVDHWGTYITTPLADGDAASVIVKTEVANHSDSDLTFDLTTVIIDSNGEEITSATTPGRVLNDSLLQVEQSLTVVAPNLWSVEKPYLYKALTTITV